MTNAFHSDLGIPWLSSIRDSLLAFRHTTHATTPTAAPPKCEADETELIPAFCSRVTMIWNKIQRTKANQAGNRIKRNRLKPQRIRKASRIRGQFRVQSVMTPAMPPLAQMPGLCERA